MPYIISEDDIKGIANALAVPPVHDGETIRFELVHEDRRLVLEIQPSLNLPDVPESEPVGLVSVYGMNAFLQLHGVTGILASEELGEVIFFARRIGTTSGLVVERAAGCSLYANVNDQLLASDFTKLPAEVMMSAVALSISETLFGDLS